MKKICLALACISTGLLQAQSSALLQGIKFKAVTEAKFDMAMTLMGQDMQMENATTNFFNYGVKTVTGTGYTMDVTLTRAKLSATVMGQSQVFDTDDEALRNTPQFADIVKMLNKPSEIIVENKGAIIKGELGDMITGSGMNSIGNDQSKFILTGDLSKLHEGFKWMDSTVSEQAKSVNEYTVIKIGTELLDIEVKTRSKINATITQNGLAIKQDVQGMTTSQRHYEKATGLLTKEEAETAVSGNMEVMGQSSPITMKGKIITTVTK